MAYQPLSKLDDYQLVHRSQDIRGHAMMDAAGKKIGTVDDLLVNTDTNRVETIVLNDGREFSADAITIDDQRAYLKDAHKTTPTGTDADRSGRAYTDAHVQRGLTSFADYEDAYREHHRTTYGEGDFADYEPAYRHGYEYGTADRYTDRDYAKLEDKMRRSYEERHGKDTWTKVKDAVRHGFEHARKHRRSST